MKPVWRPTQGFVQEKVTNREKFTCDIHSIENTRVMCLLLCYDGKLGFSDLTIPWGHVAVVCKSHVSCC